jgi:hypothetical protein
VTTYDSGGDSQRPLPGNSIRRLGILPLWGGDHDEICSTLALSLEGAPDESGSQWIYFEDMFCRRRFRLRRQVCPCRPAGAQTPVGLRAPPAPAPTAAAHAVAPAQLPGAHAHASPASTQPAATSNQHQPGTSGCGSGFDDNGQCGGGATTRGPARYAHKRTCPPLPLLAPRRRPNSPCCMHLSAIADSCSWPCLTSEISLAPAGHIGASSGPFGLPGALRSPLQPSALQPLSRRVNWGCFPLNFRPLCWVASRAIRGL